jgi:hypothetical protein
MSFVNTGRHRARKTAPSSINCDETAHATQRKNKKGPVAGALVLPFMMLPDYFFFFAGADFFFAAAFLVAFFID